MSEAIEDEILLRTPEGWVNLVEKHKYGTIGGREFSTELEIVASATGSGSLVTRTPTLSGATRSIMFFFHGDALLDERINTLYAIMSRVDAMSINGYRCRVKATLDSEELVQEKTHGITKHTYTIHQLDPYFWSTPVLLIGTADTQVNIELDSEDAPQLSTGNARIVQGPARWRLTIIGQPINIIVQATRVGAQSPAYAFSASNIELDETYTQVIVDNFSLDVADMKRFIATKPTGETTILNNNIDAQGNGFFDLEAGRFEFRVFLAGEFTSYTLEIYSGKLTPPRRYA